MIGSAVWKGPARVLSVLGLVLSVVSLGAPPLPSGVGFILGPGRDSWVTARSVPTVTNDDIGRDIPCEQRIRGFEDSTSSACLLRTPYYTNNLRAARIAGLLEGCCDTLTYRCLTARPPRLLAFTRIVTNIPR